MVPDVGMIAATSDGSMLALVRPASPAVGSGRAGQAGDVENRQAGGPAAQAGRVDQAGQARVGDQRARRGLLDQAGQLGRGAARVGGHRDRAQAGQGQPAEQVVRGGPGGQHDQVAAADAFPAERFGQAGHPGRGGAEGQPAGEIIGAEPDAARVPAGRGGQQDRDRAGRPGPGRHARRAAEAPGASLGASRPEDWRSGRPCASTLIRSSNTSSGTRPPLVHSAHRMPTKLPRPV